MTDFQLFAACVLGPLLSAFGIYIVARLVTAAYFRSLNDHLTQKDTPHGTR